MDSHRRTAEGWDVVADERYAWELPVLYWDQFPEWPEELKARMPHSSTVLAARPA